MRSLFWLCLRCGVLWCTVVPCTMMCCAVRSSLLHPMLEAASEYQVSEERSFSDAFTELCVPTGGKAQVRESLCVLCLCVRLLCLGRTTVCPLNL